MPSANGMIWSASPWMTKTGVCVRSRNSAVGKRYVENSARKASGGDDRTSDRASGKPDSRTRRSGARFDVAYAAIVDPSDRPQYTIGMDGDRIDQAWSRIASASR